MDVILNRLPLNEEEKAAFLAAAPGIEQVRLAGKPARPAAAPVRQSEMAPDLFRRGQPVHA